MNNLLNYEESELKRGDTRSERLDMLRSHSTVMSTLHDGKVPAVLFDGDLTDDQMAQVSNVIESHYGAEMVPVSENVFSVAKAPGGYFLYGRTSWGGYGRAETFEILMAAITKCVDLEKEARDNRKP